MQVKYEKKITQFIRKQNSTAIKHRPRTYRWITHWWLIKRDLALLLRLNHPGLNIDWIHCLKEGKKKIKSSMLKEGVVKLVACRIIRLLKVARSHLPIWTGWPEINKGKLFISVKNSSNLGMLKWLHMLSLAQGPLTFLNKILII